MQNVPFQLKEANLNLKALFIPDSDEYEFYDLDISNAEMRILCGYAQDPGLIGAFLGGKDLHCLTAAGISDFSYDDILANKDDKTTPQYIQRQIAKKVKSLPSINPVNCWNIPTGQSAAKPHTEDRSTTSRNA